MALPTATPTLAPYALLVGLTPLLPIPFVDGWIAGQLRERMVRELAARRGVTLSDEAVSALARPEDPTSLLEQAKGLGRKALWLPVKLLARKALVVFTVADVANRSAEAFVEGHLVDVALARGWLTGRDPRVVALAMARARYEEGTHPIALAAKKAAVDLKRRWPELKERLARVARGEFAAAFDPALRDAAGHFEAVDDRDYFTRLEATFAARLGV